MIKLFPRRIATSVFCFIILILIQVDCKAQHENKGSILFDPCFEILYPKSINLPDSFAFKQKNNQLFFMLLVILTHWVIC